MVIVVYKKEYSDNATRSPSQPRRRWKEQVDGGSDKPRIWFKRRFDRREALRRSVADDALEDVAKLGIEEADKGFNIGGIIADPDGDSSALCTACTLPIFSTPHIFFYHGEDAHKSFMHDQCICQPDSLLHELHHHYLRLIDNLSSSSPPFMSCSNCNRTCGTVVYHCAECDFRLDLVCVKQIKIVHKSHPHRMMVIRLTVAAAAALICSACDTRHEPSPSESATTTLSYLCNLCGYWIHPDCASLPNAIVHYVGHGHSLYLTYNLPTATQSESECAFCSEVTKEGSGVYICLNCPVLMREARVGDLCRLPLADDSTSLIPYMRESSSRDNHLDRDQHLLHPHPLILNEVDDATAARVCNACVQLVSPPFFSCSQCPAFFLHTCCAHLPMKIQHRVHKHSLFLSPKPPKPDISSRFRCKGCGLQCNGFAYSCESCDDFILDVGCALINPAITHASHNKAHILFMCRDTQFGSHEICNCCNSELSGICYECSICNNFKLHVRCALLPSTVCHAFDKHPLELITTGYGHELCEVCERDFDTSRWYYSCFECDQSFHVDCIPSVDHLSRIKLGSSVRVNGHDCAVALIRQNDGVSDGRGCGVCEKSLGNGLAYECSDCYFGIHHDCAENCLLES